ncbi:MAG: transglutaminase [Microbacterium sp.]|nr:MAG: transglutaminase [Microbacterium sp.]
MLVVALWLGLLATIPPLLRVIHGGRWVPLAAALSAVLLAVGYLLRRRRAPAIAVTLAELAVWAGAVTAMFFPGRALLGFIPTPSVIGAIPAQVRQANTEILEGVAPIDSTSAVTFLIVAALGLLTIALDHVVLTARMPLLAGSALVLVWLIPAIAVPAELDALAFVLVAASVLLLIRAEHRTREKRTAPSGTAQGAGPRRGVGAVAVAIGAVAIVGALVIGPALPTPTVVTVVAGATARIDPSLDLGRDLRRPQEIPVLTMHGDAPSLPNLRVATLSIFDGEVWEPDRLRSIELTDSALEPVVVDDGIRLTEYRTHLDITQLSSAYLPLPYPAVDVEGLQGTWRSVPYSRTILTSQANTQGQSYDVVQHLPRPTREQIQAASATLDERGVDVYAVPADTPPIVAELAQKITAGAETDYDKLIALQSWFRGSEFTYSLTTPVQNRFDDTGVRAVAAFLDTKEGYCIHFAGSFALMARTLGMPSRIVVGFLPGTPTGESVDGQRVSEVTTAELHAWPEVYFSGIGWVPFEPTKGRGTATNFLSSTSPVDNSGQDVTRTPSAAPTPTQSAAAGPTTRPDDPEDSATGGPFVRALDPRPLLAWLAAAFVVLAAPGVLAALRRARLRRRGTVGAAWQLVQDTAIDLGAAAPAAETPRAFGARLVAAYDAPHEATARLVGAIERESYGAEAPSVEQAYADAEDVRRGMLAALAASDRARVACLPRSLILRPGATLADRDVVV